VIKASIIGATGFTGAVLTDLLSRHPEVQLDALTSTAYVGRTVDQIFPHLRISHAFEPYEPGRMVSSEVVFVCLPHGEAHRIVAEQVAAGRRVVDFSADYRLKDATLYPQWYDFVHPRRDLLETAVYGLPERYRDALRGARLIANPGCFPTAAILAVLPLAEREKLDLIIVDANSGVSGAGRKATERTHFTSVQDNFRAYSEVGHRHTPEMAQEIARAAGRPVPVSFTPHLLPVDRGILATVYVRLSADADPALLRDDTLLTTLYRERYAAEPFVEVVEAAPALREVQHTNYCRLVVRSDPAAGLIKIVAVIDNLVKGASGQAVQCLNAMYGWPETLGLDGKA